MNKNIIVVLLIIIVGSGAFYGGIKYQQSKQRNVFSQAAGQRGANRNGQGLGGNRQGFRPVNGEIISADDKSITVKIQDGSSRIVFLSDKTILNKADEAEKTDLKVGEKVAVFGTDNSDGSVTAQNIQINPVEQGFRQGITITPLPKQ